MVFIMPTHYPKRLRIESLLRVVRRLLFAAVITLPTFTAVPVLLADVAPSFNSPNSVTFPQGVRDNFTITTTGIPVPKITLSGKLPGSVRLVDNGDGTATLSGKPGNGLGQVGDYHLTFTASNGVAPNATQNFTLTVTRPPLITSVNNATFVVGTPNTFTVTTRNSQPKTSLSYTGRLPGGVTFVPNNAGTATLSGTPTAGSEGIYVLTITGTNGHPPDAVQFFTLTVQDVAPVTHAPTITSAASTTFTVGTEGIFTIHTTGTPTSSIALSGTLPAWLTFVDNTDGTATLDGIPDPGGPASYSLTITATNGIAPDAMQVFTLFVKNPPPAITSADNTTFVVGTFASFTVRTSPPIPSATISFTGTLPAGINFTPNGDGTATIDGTASGGTQGNYPINITASNGTPPNTAQAFTIRVQNVPPVLKAPAITSGAATSFIVGTAGTFTITTTGSPTPTLTLDGGQPAWLSFVDNTDGTATISGTPDAGSDLTYSFTITARNGVSPVATQDFTLHITPVPASAQLVNVSTRLLIQTGDKVGIGGFIITGTASKKVLIRGIGPTLTRYGIANALQDPVLELHNSTSVLTSNDDWKVPQQAAIEATGLAPPDDREPAILLNLQPGNYTVIQSGKNGATGVGLIEVYDVDVLSTSQLTNISTRGLVQAGGNVMIGGFMVNGASGSINLVVRALGPTLTSYGVANALADPTLELHDGNGTVIRSNNNWKDSQQTQIQNSGYEPPNDLESAIAITVSSGNYTAIVRGNNNTTGVALVEVYQVAHF
ncbi:MAG TPA: putative Ig domain-containing protein [Terriglobales bacterium]|nr:putative Ig domain-containing protein [Terriglobales bacterium]